MSEICPFPISDNLSAQDLLLAAANKPWAKVMVIGVYEGQTMLRHAVRGFSNAQAVYTLEQSKFVFCGFADKADLNLEE